MASQERVRPLSVTVLSVLCLVAGVILALASLVLILGGIIAALGGAADGTSDPAIASIVLGVLSFGLAILYLAVSYGFWELRRWAWWVAIAALVAALVGSLVGFPPGSGDGTSTVTGVIVSVIVIGVLLMPSTRAAFGVTNAAARHPESTEP